MKKLICWAAAVSVFISSSLPLSVSADMGHENNIDEVNAEEKAELFETSGECGENATWVLSDDGILTISGTGDMYDWEGHSLWNSDVPWYDNRINITSV